MSVSLAAAVTPAIGAALALYLAAGSAFAWRRQRLGAWLTAAGWAANLVVFALNARIARQPPLGNMYHVLVLLALCLPAVFALLARRGNLLWAGAYFTLLAAVPMIGALAMPRNVHWRRMPALQSPWFVPHVFAYMLAYALAAAAFALLVTKWRRERRGTHEGEPDRHADAIHRILRAGFPLMTFGMLSGAIWAEQAWGRFWSWDSKETWSLITWVLYLAHLHLVRDPRTRRKADAAHALAFAALIVTFLLVNLVPKLGSALHSYA